MIALVDRDNRSSDDDDPMMIHFWWWSSDDPALMMIQWWSIFNDDLVMIKLWWWSNYDPSLMMIQWWSSLDDDPALIMIQWWSSFDDDPEKKTCADVLCQENTFLVKSECWCICKFRMYSLIYFMYCTPMFLSRSISNIVESCHTQMFLSEESIMQTSHVKS